MKIKLQTIIIADSIFKNIIDNDKENKINPIVKFKMLTYMKEFNNFISSFKTIENSKIEEYGVFDETMERHVLTKDSENFPKFELEITQLLEEEINVNIEKIKINDASLWGLTSNEMVILYDMIEA